MFCLFFVHHNASPLRLCEARRQSLKEQRAPELLPPLWREGFGYGT
jgi:hypothetical protein